MNKSFFFLLVLFLFAGSDFAFAQTQAEMDEIAFKDFKKADAELNKIYKELMNSLSKTDKSLLITAQRNWLKYRDSHCEFEANEYEGGSIQPLIHSTCLTDCTKKRIEELIISKNNRKH
jgi:uncharacterized protein YecT (DUF1311 family)